MVHLALCLVRELSNHLFSSSSSNSRWRIAAITLSMFHGLGKDSFSQVSRWYWVSSYLLQSGHLASFFPKFCLTLIVRLLHLKSNLFNLLVKLLSDARYGWNSSLVYLSNFSLLQLALSTSNSEKAVSLILVFKSECNASFVKLRISSKVKCPNPRACKSYLTTMHQSPLAGLRSWALKARSMSASSLLVKI